MLFLVGYLGVGVEIPRGGRCVTSRRRMRPGSVRSSRVERIYDDLLGAFNFSSTKRTTLSFGILQTAIISHNINARMCLCKKSFYRHEIIGDIFIAMCAIHSSVKLSHTLKCKAESN